MAGDLGEGIGDDPEKGIEAEEGLPINPTDRGDPGPVGGSGLRVPSKLPPPRPRISSSFVFVVVPSVRAISAKMLRVRSHCGCCPPSIVSPPPEANEKEEEDNPVGTKEGPTAAAAAAAAAAAGAAGV